MTAEKPVSRNQPVRPGHNGATRRSGKGPSAKGETFQSPNASMYCPCRCCGVIKLAAEFPFMHIEECKTSGEFPWLEITHDEWACSPPLMPNEEEVAGEDVAIRDEGCREGPCGAQPSVADR